MKVESFSAAMKEIDFERVKIFNVNIELFEVTLTSGALYAYKINIDFS